MPKGSPDSTATACPPNVEEIAELYCMGRLTGPRARSFEDHYITCTGCAEVVSAVEEYVALCRRVLPG